MGGFLAFSKHFRKFFANFAFCLLQAYLDFMGLLFGEGEVSWPFMAFLDLIGYSFLAILAF